MSSSASSTLLIKEGPDRTGSRRGCGSSAAPSRGNQRGASPLWHPERIDVLGVGVTALDLTRTAEVIARSIGENRRGYVVVGGVHAIVEAQDDAHLRRCINDAQLCTADGMPLVWAGRLEGNRDIARVYGPDLMLRLIKDGVAEGWSHYLYGGAPGVIETLQARLEQRFPGVRIVGRQCPPFREPTEEDLEEFIAELEVLRPTILWFGLTNPKQIRLMHRLRGRVPVPVMIGVGAAFDLNAGLLRQAPPWIQDAGLEWLFRLAMEPRRLWKRYAGTNPRFLWRWACTRSGKRG